ncbi:MAG: hypothetical protein QXT64_00610 [Desulfurococcaceae archaeon]
MGEVVKLGEVVRELVKDVRGDFKKLIEVLSNLNSHLLKLESLVDSIVKVTKELEEANRNFKALIELLKELSK